MIDFLIVYEHKVREIESICLLKAELERRNYVVDIIQVNSTKTLKYLWWKKPRVIIVYALYGDIELRYHVYRICGKIRKIVNLQWEQIMSNRNIEEGFSVPKGDAAKALHICWGRERMEQLKMKNVDNVVVTGAAQMDFLRGSLKQYYDSREACFRRFHIPEDKKVLLYISSFSYASIIEGSEQYRHVVEFFGEQTVKQNCDIHRTAKEKTLQWFADILQEKSDIFIIYRPHPSERSDIALINMEERYENFRVISDYSVKQWILITDKVYTMYSTSIAEAFFARKLCLIIRPVPIPEDIDACIYCGADYITSYEDFVASLDIYDFDSFPIDRHKFNSYYEDTIAYINICNVLESVLKDNVYDMPDNISSCATPKIMVEILKVLIKKILKSFRFLRNVADLLPDNYRVKIKEFYHTEDITQKELCSKDEINVITAKIRKVLRANRRREDE